ncbi:putative 3-methyladenine DNA glycosylase [Nitrospira sp.]|nr:putative 3-methyladenine DNA glycosylase [Nitrospira sp.]
MILKREFFERATLTVARELVGKYLIRAQGDRRWAGRIIEVEAYVGPEDKACHASKGRTPRTEVLFGPAGRAYVYLCYGMHELLNVVTERDGFPAAVLLRAIELDGLLVDGPGRVTRRLDIGRSMNRLDLTLGAELWFEDRGDLMAGGKVKAYPRIGVAYAGSWAKKPWRFRLEQELSGRARVRFSNANSGNKKGSL